MPLLRASTTAIFEKFMSFLTECGLTDNILEEQLVGFCTDGGSCVIGQFSGVATLLKSKCPLVKANDCMARRLELAVKKM